MAADDDGYVALNAPALEVEQNAMAARPERGTALAINAFTVDPADFGTVPGAAAAAQRLTDWGDRSRTEIGRVATEVTDLEDRLGRLKDMCRQGDAATLAMANTGRPR